MVVPSLKFLCSYDGRILPRYPDGKLRYQGGETRLLSVNRSISFDELMIKLAEMYGASVNLRCQLPHEDLDALISIKSEEDLTNLIEEYDCMQTLPMKIRAFISAVKPNKKVSPASSSASSSPDATSPISPFCSGKLPPRCNAGPCVRNVARPPVHPVFGGKMSRHKYAYGNCDHVYLIHNGNHWQ